MICTHTHCFWAGISRICPKCGMTQAVRPRNTEREREADKREDMRSSQVEVMWKERQGEDYGSY